MSWFSRTPESWERAWLAGRWSPDLCDTAWVHADRHPTVRNIYLALKVQHAVSGLRRHNLDYVEDFVAGLNNSWQPLTIRLLCARLQDNQQQAANLILERYLSGPIFPQRARLLAGFPLALAFMRSQQPARLRAPLRQLAINAQQLCGNSCRINRQFLQSLQKDKAEQLSIAVVGNSPSLLNRKDGRWIDQHDLVVRFNAAGLSEQFREHAGTRTDLWVVSPGLAKAQPTIATKAMALSGINPFAGQSRYWRTIVKRGIPLLALFDQQHWYRLVTQLRAPPSAGLLLLKALADEDHSQLIVNTFGFSTPEDLRKQPAGAHYSDNRTGSTRHNWQAEAALLRDACQFQR